MAAAAVTLGRRIARSGAPLTAVLSTGLSSRVPCCRSEREHPHGLCPTGGGLAPRVPPRPFSIHNRVYLCPLAGSGSSMSPRGRCQRVRIVACLLVGVRVSRSPPPRVRVSPCHCTKVCHVPVPPMSPFCALQCPFIPPQCVMVSPCPLIALMVSLCLSPCLPSYPYPPGVLFPRSSPQVWSQAAWQPPGLLSTQRRSFSNNKILVELDTSSGTASHHPTEPHHAALGTESHQSPICSAFSHIGPAERRVWGQRCHQVWHLARLCATCRSQLP